MEEFVSHLFYLSFLSFVDFIKTCDSALTGWQSPTIQLRFDAEAGERREGNWVRHCEEHRRERRGNRAICEGGEDEGCAAVWEPRACGELWLEYMLTRQLRDFGRNIRRGGR